MLTLKHVRFGYGQAMLRRTYSLLPFGADRRTGSWQIDTSCCVQPVRWPPTLAEICRSVWR
jgi:hypothetical protein